MSPPILPAPFSVDAFAVGLGRFHATRPIVEDLLPLDGHALFMLYRTGATLRELPALPYPAFLSALGPHIDTVVWAGGRALYRLKPDPERLDDASAAHVAPLPPLRAAIHDPADPLGRAIACFGLIAALVQCGVVAALFLA